MNVHVTHDPFINKTYTEVVVLNIPYEMINKH